MLRRLDEATVVRAATRTVRPARAPGGRCAVGAAVGAVRGPRRLDHGGPVRRLARAGGRVPRLGRPARPAPRARPHRRRPASATRTSPCAASRIQARPRGSSCRPPWPATAIWCRCSSAPTTSSAVGADPRGTRTQTWRAASARSGRRGMRRAAGHAVPAAPGRRARAGRAPLRRASPRSCAASRATPAACCSTSTPCPRSATRHVGRGPGAPARPSATGSSPTARRRCSACPTAEALGELDADAARRRRRIGAGPSLAAPARDALDVAAHGGPDGRRRHSGQARRLRLIERPGLLAARVPAATSSGAAVTGRASGIRSRGRPGRAVAGSPLTSPASARCSR